MRLDKFITACGAASRKEAAFAAKKGEILVNGLPEARADRQIDPEADCITYRGEPLVYRLHLYLMLHKPEGYVSATEDGRLPCVTELLLPEHQRRGLFPVGRLDRDTTGLLIMTDDGQTAHRLLSPKRGIPKIYRFECRDLLPKGAEAAFAAGMDIGGGDICRPAQLVPDEGRMSGTVTLTEGKYHEVKRMFEKIGNRITRLSRISFAGIGLDPDLPAGAWRELTEEELSHLLSQI
jgi:16S rRNA pseudouridine516 synthase